jgi:hypothetical protein
MTAALTLSKNVAIPVMIGHGLPMNAAVSTLRDAETYGRAFSAVGSLTVTYARGKYTLS